MTEKKDGQFFKCPLLKVFWELYDLCEIDGTPLFPSAIDIDTTYTPPPECNIVALYAQLEKGKETSRPHIQGYIEVGGEKDQWPTFKEMISDAKWKLVLGEGNEAHFMPANASREVNKNYCSKQGNGGRINGTHNYVYEKEEKDARNEEVSRETDVPRTKAPLTAEQKERDEEKKAVGQGKDSPV